MKKKFLSILIMTSILTSQVGTSMPVKAAVNTSTSFSVEDIEKINYDIIVDSNFEGVDGTTVDGIKTFSTVQSAMDSISSKNSSEVKVFIKNGIYKEKLTIAKPNVTLIGEDPEKTVLTYDVAAGSIMAEEHGGDGTLTYGTSKSASVTISNKATNFKAVNVTFENAFDESNTEISSKQAVAVKNEADKSIFVNCRFLGDQDTLYVNKNVTQYYYQCYIEGDVDFIFGSATAVFEECELFSSDRAGINPKGYIVAPNTEEGRLGYLILNSALTSDIQEKGSVHLGRPWHPSSATVNIDSNAVFVNTSMGYHISSKGWDEMSGVLPENNSLYEYGSYGLGAIESNTRPVLTDEEVQKYSKEAFLGDWNPEEDVNELKSLVKTSVVDLTKNDNQVVYEHDIVVDADFTGVEGSIVNGAPIYSTVQGAINSVSSKNTEEKTILVKNGTYKEKLTIDKPNVTLIGENPEKTILTYDVASGSLKEDGTTYGTSGSASVTITNKAVNFNAVNITFENAFDEEANSDIKSKQAVAVKNEADKSTFVNCRFIGDQDTLYANKNTNQYYYQCYIEGDVDFIFGSATAVFEQCEIFSSNRAGISPKGYIVAPSTEEGRLGFLILDSKLSSDIEDAGSVYLGRPWHPTSGSSLNSNAIFSNTNMGAHIAAAGWDEMSGVSPLDNNLFEYGSTGPGAIKYTSSRRVLTDEEASTYTKKDFMGEWDNSEVINGLSQYVKDSVVDLTEHDMSDVELDRAIDIMVDAGFEGENGAVVDGVRTYTTLESALATVPSKNTEEVVIFLKNGTYKEKLTIDKPNVTLIGEDVEKTIVTYDVAAGSLKEDGTAYGTSGSASVTITNKAVNFNAVNITFENAFDESNTEISSKQAVAVKNEADKSAFYNCRFIGDQDTLYANKNTTQYYYRCYIEGDVDFIFGSATAIFEECEIFSSDRAGITPKGYIVAPSTEDGRLGFLITNCDLTSDIELEGSVYLGRPWHATSSVPLNSNAVFSNNNMGAHICAKGWDQMSGVLPEDNTLLEYNNTGAGAIESPTRPVLTDEEAEKYSREAFLGDFDADARIAELQTIVKEINLDFGFNVESGDSNDGCDEDNGSDDNTNDSDVDNGSGEDNDSDDNNGSDDSNDSDVDNGSDDNNSSDDDNDSEEAQKVIAVHNFTTDGKDSSFFNISGNISSNKGTAEYKGLTLTHCLKIDSNAQISFTTEVSSTLTLVLNPGEDKTLTINGKKYKADKGILTVDLEAGNHIILKGSTSNLYYMELVAR